MRTDICGRLGCDVPIFAFSHSRDVVAAVSAAGGFGVLGASTFSPEQLEVELGWIDGHAGGRPYGVDVLIPTTYDERAEASPGTLEDMIPDRHRGFMEGIFDAAGVPPLPVDERARLRAELARGRGGMTPGGARRLLRVALTHRSIRLVVSALGTPPADVVADLRSRHVAVGAMCGKATHAKQQLEAGAEVVVAQGTEAGGHTGDVATMVLVPEVVRVAGNDATVLAAGGISHGSQIAAALAMGAGGVWCGTLWLGTRESELDSFEKDMVFRTATDGTVRRRARTGKPVRMIKSRLSEAWEADGAPEYLPTPLQGVLYNEFHARAVRSRRADLYSAPVGQSVGALTHETTVRSEMYRLQSEYGDAVDRLAGLSPHRKADDTAGRRVE